MSKPKQRVGAKSDRALAKELGVSSTAISQWRKKFPDAVPAGRESKEWERFIEQNGLGEMQRVGVLSDLRRAKLREVQLRCEALSRELKRTDKEVLTVQQVDKLLGAIAVKFRSAVLATLENDLPPKLAQLDAVGIRRVLREAADMLIDDMATCLEAVPVEYGYGSEVKLSA